MGIMSFAVGVMAGGFFGVVLTSLAVTAKREDEALERCQEASVRKPIALLEDKRRIHFVDTDGIPVFDISDGTCVEKLTSDGVSIASLCRYLDEDHAEIDGVKWQMQEFAIQMHKQGIFVSPIQT